MTAIAAEGSRLHVRRYGRGGCEILRLEGELDLVTAEQIRKVLASGPPARPGRRHLVLDLRRLLFVDSSGLGALFHLYRRTREQGGRTLVARPTAAVERVLRMSGFLKLTGRVDSVDAAVRSLEGDG